MKFIDCYVHLGQEINAQMAKHKYSEKRYTVYATIKAKGYIGETDLDTIETMVNSIDCLKSMTGLPSAVAYEGGILRISINGFNIKGKPSYKSAKTLMNGIITIVRTA